MSAPRSGAAARFECLSAAAAADLIVAHRKGGVPALALFDVRDAASFAHAHVAGAEPLTEAGLGGAIRRLAKATPVLVYCHHGNASKAYAETFADFRFAGAYSVDGGYGPLAAALAVRGGSREPPRLPAQAGAALRGFVAEWGFDPADLDAPRAQGLTPLMRAALLGRADLVAGLLAAGADPARRNPDGNNALWLACVSRDAAVVAALLEAGIDPDNRNAMGATCLMYAASSGRADMVGLLLEAGADAWLRNPDDAKAVDLASTRDCLRLLRHTAN